MYIGSTPTHKFILPSYASDVIKLRASYGQGDSVLFEKHLDDVRMDGNTIYIDLNIEETSKFVFGSNVQVQMEAILSSGKKLISPIYEVPVERVLNTDILK